MLEALVAATATGSLFALAMGARDRSYAVESSLVVNLAPDGDDLPCPWCRAVTHETDDRCPTCDRRFG